MYLTMWAKKWGIPPNAISELIQHLGVTDDSIESDGKSEAAIMNIVRLEASKKGMRLWRNNVGAAHTKTGSFIRYGLANESSAMNEKIKSADLIGIKPVLITEDHVGKTIGQFVSREVKKSGWRYTGDGREEAQMRWAQFVIGFGGDAGFTTGEGSL